MHDDTIYYTLTMNSDKTYNIVTKGAGEEYSVYKVSYITLFHTLTRIASQVNNELKRGCAFTVE